jgi:pimeloyl-ACP methyl ester carboxylesterase
MNTRYVAAPAKTVDVGGTAFAYRELGPDTGVPVILLNHLGAVLDNWDPAVVDGIAAHHHVIAFDNRGIGASGGKTPDSVEAMARDAIAFISALGYSTVDLLGFSLGGFIAQEIALRRPTLVRKMILAGTGPAGGEGIDKVTGVTIRDSVRAVLTGKDPKENLFFTTTPTGKSQAKSFIKRIKERRTDRDKPISPTAFRTQLKAIHAWGVAAPADLGAITQPVLVANGEHDRMVPSTNSTDLAHRLPNTTLKLYPDSGHGGIFQYHDEFVAEALAFLK